MPRILYCLSLALTVLNLADTSSLQLSAATARLSIFPDKLGPVDERLFSAFLEKAPPSERGPDSVTDSHGQLVPQVVSILDANHIPVIRFPGGYLVEESDWTELIDRHPGEESPSTGAQPMGLDAFLQLCDKIGSDPMLVVNLSDAFLERKSLAEAALHAAAMVAYCNLAVGSDHPLAKWAAMRAANGHPEPYGVSLWQIGNESFMFAGTKIREEIGSAATVERLVDATAAYVAAMRKVDPTIDLIADVEIHRDVPEFIPALMDRLGSNIQYLSRHYYKPWGIKITERAGVPAEPESLSPEEIWWAFSAPLATDDSGAVQAFSDPLHYAMVATGKPIALTEWNFNGGWWHHKGRALPQPSLAKGLGAAAILHAMMREGTHIRIANQSMLISEKWDIGSLRVLPGDPPARIALRPTGMVYVCRPPRQRAASP